jgi:signal transduction histidine kinase
VTSTAPAPRGTRIRALRTQVVGAFVITGLIAAVSLGLVAWAFDRQVDARQSVLDHVDPAAIRARDLFASLVDQETGVRGFALSRDPQFLVPYKEGQRTARTRAAQVRTLLADHPELARLVVDIQRSAQRWRNQSAEPLIAAVRQRRNLQNTAVLDRSKRQFDAVRRRYAALAGALTSERRTAIDEIGTRTSQVTALAIAVLALLVACAVVIVVGLRRLVLNPIDKLALDARAVTAGDIDHEITPTGPRELQTLGRDLEAMRHRIVDDLAAVEAARAQLDRQADELARSNAELEQFAYVASHDLQEPLRKVASFCQLLEQRYGDELDERGKQYLDFAVDGAKRMQQLILDLLTFSRVGRTGGPFTAVDLRHAALQAVSDLDEPISEKHAVVEIDDLPTVQGDATLLTSLFQNLVSNAVKFNDSDVPRVTISARETADGWELACADNGIGIEPQHADRVFVIFQRLHGRDVYGGTGIGLALAQKIVSYHGGSIWIDEGVTEGTTIRWTLPTDGAGVTTS